jgi:hypothetical protein
MRSVVICGRDAASYDQFSAVHTIKIDGLPVSVGLVETKEVFFNPRT